MLSCLNVTLVVSLLCLETLISFMYLKNIDDITFELRQEECLVKPEKKLVTEREYLLYSNLLLQYVNLFFVSCFEVSRSISF